MPTASRETRDTIAGSLPPKSKLETPSWKQPPTPASASWTSAQTLFESPVGSLLFAPPLIEMTTASFARVMAT